MSYDQRKTWVDNIGKYGAYGKEFTDVTTADGAGSVTDRIPWTSSSNPTSSDSTSSQDVRSIGLARTCMIPASPADTSV